MNVPDDRRYTEEHEWALLTPDGTVRLGITAYAQEALGDIVYVELPTAPSGLDGALEEVSSAVDAGETPSVRRAFAAFGAFLDRPYDQPGTPCARQPIS